ncbi:pentapeptide repeat-containing protein [Nocardia xishanensis]|uniref:Pentapeptide repeat-containing protein n=1 Tax=Nocardia xishanensis TaxID=238964 RepID=A0ABW7X718_9NOCA
MTALATSFGTVLAAVAASGALYFTGQTLQAANTQNSLTRQTSMSDRFRAAAEQLASDKVSVRTSGVLLLERLAKDSPDDSGTVLEMLVSFIRNAVETPGCRLEATDPSNNIIVPEAVQTDVYTAFSVIQRRDTRSTESPTLPALSRACFSYANLSGIAPGPFNFAGTSFLRAVLQRADLSRANLTNAILTSADLTEANLTDADLTGARVALAKLTHAKLVRANLTGVKLTQADMYGANLSEANLTDMQLSLANLTRADLTRAKFGGYTDLYDANLTSANLTGANLAGANLTSANLTGANLTDIRYDQRTRWPEGFTPPPSR